MAPNMSSIPCRFVPREEVSQSKYCCSLKVKIYGPSQKFWHLQNLFGPKTKFLIKIHIFAKTRPEDPGEGGPI